MSIIIKDGKFNAKRDKNQIYTWAACVMVLIFAVSIAAAVKGNSSDTPSEQAYRRQAFDLGEMPFDNDSAEAYLLASNKYNDIARNDLIEGLFSKEDKAARQADDALNGVPAAPDDEYKAAQEEKAAKRIRENLANSKKASSRGKSPRPATVKGSLSGGSMASVSGGGGRSVASVSYGESSAVNKGVASAQNQEALLKQIKNGKALGFNHAVLSTARAANASDLEAASAGAVDAFQKGAQHESDDFLNGEMEKDSSESALAIDEDNFKDKLEKASNSAELADLDSKIEQAKKKKEAESINCDTDPFEPKCLLKWGMSIVGTAISAKVANIGKK